MKRFLIAFGLLLAMAFSLLYVTKYNYLLTGVSTIYLTGHTTAYLTDYKNWTWLELRTSGYVFRIKVNNLPLRTASR